MTNPAAPSSHEEVARPGFAGWLLWGAAVTAIVAAGLVLWSARASAVFVDMLSAAVAWCF